MTEIDKKYILGNKLLESTFIVWKIIHLEHVTSDTLNRHEFVRFRSIWCSIFLLKYNNIIYSILWRRSDVLNNPKFNSNFCSILLSKITWRKSTGNPPEVIDTAWQVTVKKDNLVRLDFKKMFNLGFEVDLDVLHPALFNYDSVWMI